jgi:hypothetical protein
MSNTGMELEDEVFALVERLLKEGKLPYNPSQTRLHRRKSYHSPLRGKPVNFENVLEVFVKDNIDVPDAQPSHVIFFECKDHGRNVEVGKVDEVVGRLQHPFGFNMKAYIVTRRGFSDGALNTARSKGIGLLKIMPDEKVKFVMYHMTSLMIDDERERLPGQVAEALLNEDYEAVNAYFFGLDDDYCFSSLGDVLTHHWHRLHGSTQG